jgi:hypothetical protein
MVLIYKQIITKPINKHQVSLCIEMTLKIGCDCICPAHERQRLQDCHEFEASLFYIVSSRPTWDTTETLSQKKEIKQDYTMWMELKSI